MGHQELTTHNEELTTHNEELTTHNEELTTHNEGLTTHNEELTTHNEELTTHNEEAPASRTPDPAEVNDRTTSEAAEPQRGNVVSMKKAEANRANARHSTGPKTDEGKRASSMNAVRHGLLAQTVVITAGDYQEDEQAFAELLEGLREQWKPVGVAEDLEVQQIALYYWRKTRAARYEHGAIRKRTGDVRKSEERVLAIKFDVDMGFGSDLEGCSRGIQYLLDTLQGAKHELRSGSSDGECFGWLTEKSPDEFPEPDVSDFVQKEGEHILATDYVDAIVDTIDEELDRLTPLHATVAEREVLNLESEIHAATLPTPKIVDSLIRYETSNDRALDRALKRLEAMQARRQKQEDAPAEK